MEVTKNNIEEYIRRFMEGETTNAEEQAIYRFFRTEEVPEHLKPYTEMFAWYEEGMPEEELSKPKTQPLWKRIPLEIWSTGIAAMLVIGIGLGILVGGIVSEHIGYHAAFWTAWGVNLLGVCIFYLFARKHFLQNKLR